MTGTYSFFKSNRLQLAGRLQRLLLTAVMPLVCLTLHAQQDTVQGVIRQDYEALAAIYEALGGRFWTSENEEEPYPTCYFNDWMTFVPVSDWYGVTVENSRVVKLVLVNNRLYDQLPNAIGNLTALRELVLKNNAIHGAIPATIANITTLEKLDLSYNHFDQPVPPAIFAIPNLRELILNDNHIPGPLTIAQPATTLLQKLRLENNALTGAIPNNIGSLTQLKSLHLSNNEISGAIPASFRNLTLLDSVYIQFNNINAINPAYIKTSYSVFDCSNNNLDFTDLVPLNVTGKPWLNYAPQKDLGTIEVTGKQTGNSYTLQGIDYRAGNQYQWFRWSYINNNTDWQLVGTGSNHSLNSLNKNNDEGTYRCVITNAAVPNLEIYTKPVHIYVDYNAAVVNLAERYYIEWAKYFLSTNGLPWRNICVGWDKSKIKNWLNSNMNYINWLKFPEEIMGTLPESFGILTEKFKSLWLQDCHLSGKLPESIEDSISHLSLSNNYLSGKIPENYFDVIMHDLRLDYNNFYGKLPSEIFIKSFRDDGSFIFLYVNKIYGKMPQWQSGSRYLLRIYGNCFSGIVSNVTFDNLIEISAGYNYITQLDIKNHVFRDMSHYAYVDFRNNNISGDLLINLECPLSLNLEDNYINSLQLNHSNIASLYLDVTRNYLTFESLLPLSSIQNITRKLFPQRHFGETKRILRPNGSLLIYNLDIDNNITDNIYKWYKFNVSNTNSTLVYQSNINKLVISNMTSDKQGIYYCVVTNPRLSGVSLQSKPIVIEMGECEYFQSEIATLLELRNTNGGISTQQWSFDINTDISQWPGVTVENCHVTGIHLPNEGLTGVLPESLCNLEYLNSVDFSGNPELLAPVPPCVCQLMNLYYDVSISRPSPTPICPGGSIVLQASVANASPENFRYHWYDPLGNLLGTVTGDPLFEVYHITSATLGEYRVEVESLTEQLSCGGSGAYTIDASVFHPLPVITLVGYWLICPGGTVTLRASVAGINPGDLTYRWYNPSGQLLKTATGNPLIELTNVTAASTGTYRVEVESLSGLVCGSGAYTLSASSLFSPLPAVSVTNILHTTCADSQDGSASVSVTGRDATYTYTVFHASGIAVAKAFNYTSGRLLSVTGLPVGVYTIRGTTAFGCEYTQTFEIRNGGPVVEFCMQPAPCDIQTGQTVFVNVQFRVTRLRVGAGSYTYYIVDDRFGVKPIPVTASYNTWVTHSLGYVHGRSYSLYITDCNLRVPLEFKPLEMSISGIRDEYRRCHPSQPLNITGNIGFTFPKCFSGSFPKYGFDGLIRLYSVADNGMLALLQTQSTQSTYIGLSNFTRPAGRYLLRITGTVFDANKVSYGICLTEHYFTVTSNDLSVAVDVTDELCPNEKNGSATARVSGGTPPYEYFWYRGTALVSKGATVQGLAPGSYTLRVKDALPCDVTAGATAFTVRAAAAMGNITVTVPDTSSPDCAVTATLHSAQNGGRYRFEWMRIVPSTDPLSPARDVTVLTDEVTAAAGVATSITNLNIIRPGFEYYVVVTDPRGCRKSTRGENKPGMVVRPVVQRDYALYFRWQSEEEMDDTPPAPPPAVNDRAALAASDIKRKFEDAPLECAAEAQLKAETRFADYCTAIEHLHDELEIKYRTRAGHFTLYYYDRAGNLSKTVPPAGIRPCTNLAAWAGHTMVTEYRHNTLGQVVWQRTPDAGESQFLYDGAGRLRFSQSAQQAVDNKFSYTKYDELGRPRETGQGTFRMQGIPYTNWSALAAANNTLYATEQNQSLAQRFPAATVAEPVVEYRTITRYDEKTATWNSRPQRYTLNRISSVEHRNPGFLDVTGKPVTYEPVTTRYSYDPHGNVEWTTTDIPELGARGTEYEYDLVSGNVTQVAYDRGYIDQFFHRYQYDEDNRLVNVQTSENGDLWETEASYNYYAHGPLRRTEVGNDRLQGIDYVYTLQGWLKGINPHWMPYQVPAQNTPFDQFGMILTYYNGDYANSRSNVLSGALASDADKQLYNGNIATWMWNTPGIDGSGAYFDHNFHGQKFTYDRLNRIRDNQFYNINTGTSWEPTSQYSSTYTYDPNGNIRNLFRSEFKEPQGTLLEGLMDGLTYSYQSGTNKLDYVSDIARAGEFNHDIDGQNPGNYSYDASGNLIQDKSEKISIEWAPSGKVKRILKANNGAIAFLYDAAGNRVAKKATDYLTYMETAATFYIPDAQGNIMATYNRTAHYSSMSQLRRAEYRLGEQPVYGSSRLGVRSSTGYMVRNANYGQMEWVRDYSTTYTGLTARTLGRKQYELTDHLGNVRVLFGDRLTKQQGSLSPNILAINNYYPYGMLIKSLSQNSETYRWGFQGHEQDNEIKGAGNHLRFGDYGYDTRLGRRWNLDPVDQIGISNYAVFKNNPIINVDPDGKWPWENKNIRNARKYARKSGGTFEKWEGANGMTYASVTSSKTYSDGENSGVEVTAKVFSPTEKNQKSGFINFVEAIDIPEGHADGANLGIVTKQDVIVGGSIIGAMAGVGTLIGGGAGIGVGVAAKIESMVVGAGVLSNVDNAFTNSQEQSGLQQMVGEGKASEVIGYAKDIIGVATFGFGFKDPKNLLKSPFNIIGIGTDATSIVISAPKYNYIINPKTNEK